MIIVEINGASFGLKLDEKCQKNEFRNKNYLMKILCLKYPIEEKTESKVAVSLSGHEDAEELRRGGSGGSSSGGGGSRGAGGGWFRWGRNSGNNLKVEKLTLVILVSFSFTNWRSLIYGQ